ncbi:MAG: 50S ribosomal protein L9 [Firmicutes bacterium]|nr:50S ribosomal protein L9 [Bacillota bacterium]
MKVILTQDVKAQGKKGEIVDVSDGYAKNFLLKNKLAIPVSNSALNEVKQAKEAAQHKKDVEKAEALAIKKRLTESVLILPIKVSERGKIFGSLTSQIIADGLKKQGIELDKRKIVLEENIKLVGRYTVLVKLYPEVSAKVEIEVVPL